MKVLLQCACLLLGSGIAEGQQHPTGAPAARPQSENPRERLAFLVGSFATETRVLPGRMVKKESVGNGTSEITWVLDSMFLFIDEKSVNPALGAYKGFGLLGYSPHDRLYTLSMYNNFGDRPQYQGAFAGDTLVLTAHVPAPGKSFDQEVRWYPEGENVRLDVLNDTGSGFIPVMNEIARRRQSGTAAPEH